METSRHNRYNEIWLSCGGTHNNTQREPRHKIYFNWDMGKRQKTDRRNQNRQCGNTFCQKSGRSKTISLQVLSLDEKFSIKGRFFAASIFIIRRCENVSPPLQKLSFNISHEIHNIKYLNNNISWNNIYSWCSRECIYGDRVQWKRHAIRYQNILWS